MHVYTCRLDKIEEPEVYQYEDALDHFEREPYGIFVKPKEIGEHVHDIMNWETVCVSNMQLVQVTYRFRYSISQERCDIIERYLRACMYASSHVFLDDDLWFSNTKASFSS